MTYTIRSARAEDAQHISAFNISMALETENKRLDPEIVAPGVATLLMRPELGFYLVAESDHQIIGSLMITSEWSDWRNGLFWWIQSVYILPEHRRKGVFTSMYNYTKGLAADQESVCGLRLYVERDNATAQQTYIEVGMEETYYLMYEEAF